MMRATLNRVAPFALASLLAFVAASASAATNERAASRTEVQGRGAANVSTLAQYRERVREAIAPLEELAAFCEQLSKYEREGPEVWKKEGFDPNVSLQLPKKEQTTFDKVRGLLPPKEKVERAN